ncbi:trypsin, alkaline C-like [Ostrinia furnacalis]|uniref:trypsin, alkaline C-like n=1 Tax=Ostrinia furnacalis TaxID=93504 RepID=UPI00103A7FA2|nr:trypsin, alkaline C-like [Ostrinia furnacalis]
MRGILVLLWGLAAVSAAPKSVERIIGGSLVSISQYPEMVGLLYSLTGVGHRQWCGGTTLNSRAILTAAHCTMEDPPFRWSARVGSNNANSGGTVIASQQIINHPQFTRADFNNDICVIITSTNIPFSANVQPGRIAGTNYHLADNEPVWAAGWGTTWQGGWNSEQLRHVQVYSVNQEACRQRYAVTNNVVNDNMLCSGILDVGGRDQCQGDSGGPLFHHGVVVGVCSWGRGCAQPQFPGVNTRVSRYTDWIRQHAENILF